MKMALLLLGVGLSLPMVAQAAPVVNALPSPSPMQNQAMTRVPYSASSMDSEFFALVAQMSGHCSIENGQLMVYVNRGRIFYRDTSNYRGPRPVVSLSAKLSVADGGAGKWKPICNSNEIPVNVTLNVNQSIPLNDLTFTIPPGNQQIDLSKCWITFQIMSKTAEGGPAFSYLHTDRKVFAPYVGNGQ